MGDLGPSGDFRASHRASLPSTKPTKSFWQTSHPNAVVNYRSTPALREEADVILVGSGITSAFAVWELLKASNDLNVLVLEARTTCSGATGRNGGHLLPMVHEHAPHLMGFEMKTCKLVEDLITTHNIPCDFRKLSGCHAFWNKSHFEDAKKAIAEARKIDPNHAKLIEIVEDQDQLREFGLKGAVGAIAQSAAASLSPYKLVVWMWQAMIDEYADRLNFQTSTPVASIDESSIRPGFTAVSTSRGAVYGKQVVVASNGYASYLLPEFDGIITPTQGQMSASIPHGTYSKQLLPRSYGFTGIGNQDGVMSDYLVQGPLETGGHLMLGGGRQMVPGGGVGVSDDSYVDIDAEAYLRGLPERLDLKSPSRPVEREEPTCADQLDMISSWTGIMGYSVDHFPWVGAVPDRETVWICAGYTGHGMPNAPGCGRYIAQCVAAALKKEGSHEMTEGPTPRQEIPEEYLVSESRLGATAKNKQLQLASRRL
jgi:glycine/D-amino acid oxidase-like deaminating enzyme